MTRLGGPALLPTPDGVCVLTPVVQGRPVLSRHFPAVSWGFRGLLTGCVWRAPAMKVPPDANPALRNYVSPFQVVPVDWMMGRPLLNR